MKQLTEMQRLRFLTKFKRVESGCWEWIGSLNTEGYGQTQINKRNEMVHKVSYRIFKGPTLKGFYVCHSCDNKICGNPNHLWLGTPKENTQDSINKGRYFKNRKLKKCHS